MVFYGKKIENWLNAQVLLVVIFYKVCTPEQYFLYSIEYYEHYFKTMTGRIYTMWPDRPGKLAAK